MNVYVACPLTLYEPDARYRRLLRQVKRCFPKATLISPKDSFTSTRDWRESFPGIVRSLDALVIVPDTGRIGTGVLREATDALFCGVPVYCYDPEQGQLTSADKFAFVFDQTASPSLAVRLIRRNENDDDDV